LPSLVIPELNARIKIKPVTGTWRVILPHKNPAWLDVAQIPHPTYDEARDAALLWAEVLSQADSKKKPVSPR
jgi:hypothetical protein